MKAIRLQRPRQFECIEIDDARRPGPGEALVRVHRVGICGTDISGYLGKMPFYSYPRIPGHELGVEVLEVGPSVGNVRPGDHCAVEPYLNCQACLSCRRGRPNCCERLEVLGVHTDGGLRPRFVVPARKLHRSEKLTLEQLALVETLGIGCHAVDRAAPESGEHALVVGAGPIGLAVIEFAKLAGAHTTVLDLNRQRLDFCKQTMGVDQVIQALSDGNAVEVIRSTAGGELPTIVFDATGNARSMSESFNYVSHTGKLVFVGIVTTEISFADPLFHAREMTVLASRNALPRDFARIITLIESGRLDTRPWITHRTPFDELIDRFPSFTVPETGVIKAMVDL
jgi:alcohol dehydrogenase